MPLFPRLLTLLLLTAGAAHVPAATTTSSKSKSKGKSSSTSTSASKSKSGTTSKSGTSENPKSKDSSSAKPDTPAEKKAEQAVVKEDTPQEPRPAAVSTMSIEEIRDFDKYPKQVQSLVQSALALTHLELRYMYGSHEPNKGGMDCSGTMYHLLHFQGLKDVPRQSDEMAMWVERKSQLHLTPTATDFDSPEFADLKPGDLLFWTNTTATTRKLPVTHVMVYLGKRKKDGKRIIFGSSDGRSFSGMRRSGVSVFDFHLPRAEGTARLHGYGMAPGLMPQELVLASTTSKPVATPPAAVAATAPTPVVTVPVKEEPKQPEAPKTASAPLYVKVKKEEPKQDAAKVAELPAKSNPTPPEAQEKEASKPAQDKPAVVASNTEAKTPSATATESKEEVRKAVAVVSENDGTGEEVPMPIGASKSDAADPASKTAESATASKSETKKVASSSSSSKPKSSSASKPKSSTSTTTKKKSVQVSSKRRTPPPPQRSQVEQVFDRAVNSVRRVFR